MTFREVQKAPWLLLILTMSSLTVTAEGEQRGAPTAFAGLP